MNKILKIGIDIDGILADFTAEMTRILREDLHIELPVGYVPSDWDWIGANLPAGAMDKAWRIIGQIDNFWEKLSPTEDIMAMAEFFHQHAGKDCDIYFITARKDVSGRSAKTQSENWLYDHLGEPKFPITVLPVKGGLDKAEVIYALRLNASIDDHTPTVCNNKSIVDHKAYLLDRPWNQDGKFYGLKTVKSLREFFEKVNN